MIEFHCRNCAIAVTDIISETIPEDQLCQECRTIQEAAPEDRKRLAIVFRKPIADEPVEDI